MLVQQGTGDWLYLRVEFNGFQGHFSDDFKSQSILDRFFSTWSPHKWPVAMHKHGANLRRVEVLKPFHNDVRRLQFVGGTNFLSSHGPRHWHFTIEVIGMRRTKAGNPPAGLSECDGIARVGMHNGADPFECLEESTVRRCIG